MGDLEEWLSVEDLAQELRVDRGTVYTYTGRTRRKIRAGKKLGAGDLPLPDKYVGQSPLWRRETIEEWLPHRPSESWNRKKS